MIDWTTVDWTTVISIIGIIGTWVTIALVYFTLREMKNQRKASQKPEIVIPEVLFYGYANHAPPNETFPLMVTKWSDKEINQEVLNPNWRNSIPIKLYNVGFGVAKNVKLRWVVDYDKTVQQMKDYCYKNSVPIILEVKDDRLSISGENIPPIYDGELWLPFVLRYGQYEHDFLMPTSITSEGLESHLPLGIIQLFAISAYLKSHYSQVQNPSGEFDVEYLVQYLNEDKLKIDLPSIQLELHYDDLEDSHYSKKFEVILSERSHTDYTSIEGLIKVLGGSFEFKKAEPISEMVRRQRRVEQLRREREK